MRRRNFGVAILGTLAMMGCETMPAKESGRPATSGEPISLKVTGRYFDVKDDKEVAASVQPLAQGSSVKSGQGFGLSIALSRPALAHVVQFTPSGKGYLIYPAGNDPRGPLQMHNVPGEANTVLALDNEIGLEILYVIVTEVPLAQAAPDLAALVQEVETKAGAAIAVTFEVDASASHVLGSSAPPAAASPSSATAPSASSAAADVATPIKKDPKPVPIPPRECGTRVVVQGDTPLRGRGKNCSVGRDGDTPFRQRGPIRVSSSPRAILEATTDTDGVAAHAIVINHL